MAPSIAANTATYRNRLRETRELAGLSMEQLVARSGITKPTIWKIETDPDYRPRPAAQEALARALNVNVGWLFYIEGREVPKKR